MKKFIFLCLFLLWGLGGFAQVSVTNLATNYATKQISFTVSWTAPPYNNQIWVITDYVKVENATTVGSWSRATVTTVNKTAGTGSLTISGNLGFWLNTSGASGSADITATLSGVPAQFNWCATALDYPPQAVIKAAGGYDLKGTPPFTVNGTTLGENVKTYGAGTCITSLSDATNNPTSVLPDLPAVATSNPAARCGAGKVTLNATASGGTTTDMTYTWIVGGDAPHTTPSGSLSLSSVAEGSTTYSVTVTNANSCTSAPETGTITVHTAVAQATISGSASNNCPATSVSLTASASGATSFTWYRNGSDVLSGSSSATTVNTTGSYTVRGKNENCLGPASAALDVYISVCGNIPGCGSLTVMQPVNGYIGPGTKAGQTNHCLYHHRRHPTVAELQCILANAARAPFTINTSLCYWAYERDDYYSYVVCGPNGSYSKENLDKDYYTLCVN